MDEGDGRTGLPHTSLPLLHRGHFDCSGSAALKLRSRRLPHHGRSYGIERHLPFSVVSRGWRGEPWRVIMPAPHEEFATEIGAAVATAVRRHSLVFFGEGIFLIVLGALAIFLPLFATITITIILAWIFLASGVVGLVATFGARQAPGFWWSLVSAIIAIAVGVVLLIQPIAGALSLTLVLIVFFVVEGISGIIYAMEHRRGSGTLGVDALQRPHRFDPGRNHFRWVSRHRRVGARIARRHQHGHGRSGPYGDRRACPQSDIRHRASSGLIKEFSLFDAIVCLPPG